MQIPLPRTKRSHRKSRAGCSRCRQRRVKCDEVKPVCNACHRKGLDCAYDSNLRRINDTGERAHSPPSGTPASPLEQQPSASSLHGHGSTASSVTSTEDADAEFELGQTYFDHVAASFSHSCASTGQNWIWHVFVPAQASVSSTVRHGMLAAAAIYLHLQIQDRGEMLDPKLLDLATAHGNAFIAQSRAELHVLAPANSNSNVASTRLLFVLALAFYRHRRAGGGTQEVMSWTWLHLLKGIETVYKSLVTAGQKLHPTVQEDMTSELVWAQSTSSNSAHQPHALSYQPGKRKLLLYLKRTQHARFATLRFAHSRGWLGFSGDNADIISAVIDRLNETTDRICAGRYVSLFRVIISWIASVPDIVLRLLTNEHPGVLALYTHWLMLLTLMEDLWWVGDMGRVSINVVLQILDRPENDLAPVLSWPKEILNMR